MADGGDDGGASMPQLAKQLEEATALGVHLLHRSEHLLGELGGLLLIGWQRQQCAQRLDRRLLAMMDVSTRRFASSAASAIIRRLG